MKAFPEVNYVKPLGNGQSVMTLSGGMDLRDYFAGQAIDGFLADGGWGGDLSYFEDVAEGAYKMADAMLKARAA
jgi:hypothetical protein